MLNKLLSKLIHTSQNMLAPSGGSCLVCQSPSASSSGELQLCRKCYTSIAWIKPRDILCSVCGRFESCPDCHRRKDTWFKFNLSVVRYDDAMKDWLGRLKYRGDVRLQLLFAGMFESLFYRFLSQQRWKAKDISVITYVPLSKQRLEERGFNQAELFARALGSRFHIPVAPLLDRKRHTGKQSYKTRMERIHDLQGVFVPNDEGVKLLRSISNRQARHIIIVDDVYTTGSTMNECARVISVSAPNASIYSLTWAR